MSLRRLLQAIVNVASGSGKTQRRPASMAKLQFEFLEARELLAADPFSIVVLPDTQVYAQHYPQTFNAQLQWIVDHREEQNLVFVAQEGDIVQSAESGADRNATQWKRADSAFDKLDGDLVKNPNGLIPYSVAIGNHDYGKVGDKSAGARRYLEYFGPDRYEGRSWYGGSSDSGLNHFQIFNAGDYRFMHFALQWEPTTADIAWAQSVINAHPGLPTIISTHSYLNDATRSRTTSSTSGGLSGEQMFQKLVKPNAQVFMVLNGHFSGEYHQTSTNAAGLPVFEMVADFQSRTEGGQGFMPIVTFDPAANQIRVRTYSPVLDRFETDSNSQYAFNVNFNSRFGPPPPAPPPPPAVQVATFRDGDRGYTGTIDTNLKQKDPATTMGPSVNNLLVDASSDANASTVLLRFDSLFGANPGQIPVGAMIVSAEVILDTNNPGDGGAFHRMAKPWKESDTWNFWKDGIQADGKEASKTFTAQAGSKTRTPNVPVGRTVVNVTADIQAWAAGAANNGWAVLPWSGGTDGWGFSPSEVATKTDRPQLRIEWLPAAPAAKILSFQDGVSTGGGIYQGTSDTVLKQAEPTTRGDSAPLITIDGPTANDARVGLLKFDNLFGTGVGQIPAGAEILWAQLVISTPSGVTNAESSGASFYRLTNPWNDSATWSNTFGGNGIPQSRFEFSTGRQTPGAAEFDVTAAVRSWAAGEANHGWGIDFDSTDAWIFGSAEREAILERPRLILAWR